MSLDCLDDVRQNPSSTAFGDRNAVHPPSALTGADIKPEPPYLPSSADRAIVDLTALSDSGDDDSPSEASTLSTQTVSRRSEAKPFVSPSSSAVIDSPLLSDSTNDASADDVPDQLVKHNVESDQAIWQLACDFFGHDIRRTDSQTREDAYIHPAFSISLKPHQLFAVFRILFMFYLKKTYTVLLADGMGVGKTLESSAVVIFTPYLHDAIEEVQSDRDRNSGRHLPKGTMDHPQPDAAECPSGTYAKGFACPCVERLPSSLLMARDILPIGPAVVLTPPALRDQWLQELRKYISSESRLSNGRTIQIWSIHTSSSLPPSHRRIRGIMYKSETDLEKDDITEAEFAFGETSNEVYLPGRPDNGHIIMVMPLSTGLRSIQQESSVQCKLSDDPQDSSFISHSFFIKPSYIIVDEMHSCVSKTTVAWQFILSKLVARSSAPTYFIGISGTPIRSSPAGLEPFFDVVALPVAQTWKSPPRAFDRPVFTTWVKETTWLVNHRGYLDAPDEAKQREYVSRFEKCKALREAILAPYVLQRHSHHLFFGHPISPLPPLDIHVRAYPQFPQVCFAAIQQLAQLSKQQMEDKLQKRLDAWHNAPPAKRGTAPTLKTVLSEIKTVGGKQGSFYDLAMCATLPGLAPFILQRKPISYRSRDIPTNIRRVFHHDHDNDVSSTPLAPYLDRMAQSSPKMEAIRQLVNEMRADQESIQASDGRTIIPVKKMIIFTVAPMTAYLIGLLLRKQMPDLRLSIVLSNENATKRSVLYEPFSRPIDADPVDADQDPVVLLTTVGISADGLNLTRANYAILVEPAFCKDVERQAFHRIHRLGQRLTTHLFELQSPWNPAERILRNRVDVRDQLLWSCDAPSLS
ncbi:hypothetical protein F5Y03DRAFT_114267 [Xylaria venustula]|nr:hypothetical protein F5Y03DRAFT_114267 [Xylaria venustula]